MIFVSTGGFHNLTGAESAKLLFDAGVSAVELSGGKSWPNYSLDLKALTKSGKLQVHNYFPPPAVPFVFNLASSSKEIYQASFNHVINSMRLAIELDSPSYSFHAGYLLDPKVNELGRQISAQNVADRNQVRTIFIERVVDLAQHASQLGIKLLIENNVISSINYKALGHDPLLFTEPNEIVEVMKQMPANIGLLMDLAHLKVSSVTLGFNAEQAIKDCMPWIEALHLSDNDGLSDSNQEISQDSWFWKFLDRSFIKKLSFATLEVYRDDLKTLKSQVDLVQTKFDQL